MYELNTVDLQCNTVFQKMTKFDKIKYLDIKYQ